MEGRIIIGDIHGGCLQLTVLLQSLASERRQLIFLGDYVNRGSDSKGVLDILAELQQTDRTARFLCGNHDWALRQYISRGNFEPFALMGGLSTLSAYLGENIGGDLHLAFTKSFPPAHQDFLNRLEAYYEDDHLFCSHTGLSPQAPFDRTFEQTVLQSHPQMFQNDFVPPKMTICGHYPQRNGLPLERNNLVCLDTGCGTDPNGRLTALILPERKFLQIARTGKAQWIMQISRPSYHR